MLRPLLESGAAIRRHVNNGAVVSFVDTIPLLHLYGRLICHDLFVTDVHTPGRPGKDITISFSPRCLARTWISSSANLAAKATRTCT